MLLVLLELVWILVGKHYNKWRRRSKAEKKKRWENINNNLCFDFINNSWYWHQFIEADGYNNTKIEHKKNKEKEEKK